MSDVLDRAKSHFAGLLDGAELLNVDVPEWETKIYFKPLKALKVQQFDKVLAAERKGNVEGFVDMLIIRALDESGKPVFKPVNRLELIKHASPTVISRIISDMGEAELESEQMGEIEPSGDLKKSS